MVVNTNIFLGSGANLALVPELDLYIKPDADPTADDVSFIIDSTLLQDVVLVENLYIGCICELYDSSNTFVSAHRITGNDTTTFNITPKVAATQSGGYWHIRGYGAPSFGEKQVIDSNDYATLNADQWLGILESATFPTTEVEMKQLNSSLGGSRNFTLQYKGIETASGANLGLVANHGTWLYYFLGKCTAIKLTTTSISAPTDEYTPPSGQNGSFYLETGANGTGISQTSVTEFNETGPLFYRNVGSFFYPPILKGVDDKTKLTKLTLPTMSAAGGTITAPIEYTFAEQNSDDLPSFAIEQSLSKLDGQLTTFNNVLFGTSGDSADEHLNFVKIARGNRVNTLTLTANENEEVKMTLDLNTRAVSSLKQGEKYLARRNVTTSGAITTDETELMNYKHTTTTNEEAFREPFFFSSGTFKILGNTFLKINTLTLTMNNNLQDRRFIGVGSKSVKEGIPAQRTYEISFTGHVSDDALYRALLEQSEDTTQTIELIFEKANGEKITLNFDDYFISANNFPIPDDKGPIVVEATVMPRTLNECKVITHWILQG